ncbi:MAG: transketolase C-terminal domain-containing protein [Bacteroidales bacterium]
MPGNDLTIMATGHMVWEAIQAAEILGFRGIRCRVINMHTIKPIDKEAIIRAAHETKAIVTAEEHQVNTGLGSAVAEVVVQNYPVPMAFIGMPDQFGESGDPHQLMEKFKLTARDIVAAAQKLFGDKVSK